MCVSIPPPGPIAGTALMSKDAARERTSATRQRRAARPASPRPPTSVRGRPVESTDSRIAWAGPQQPRLLVVCGLRRACVLARGGHLLPPVSAGDHLPDLPLGQIRVCRRRVRLDALNKVVVVLAGEVDVAVRRI